MANDGAITPLIGRPGVSSGRTANYGTVFRNTFGKRYFPGGGVCDGTKTRDPENANVNVLRPGLMLGRTSGGKLATAVLGTLQGAAAANATSLTLTAATAAELVRRIGTSGTFTLTGPPTAGGTVAAQTVTFSAVNTTTGVVTCSALSAAAVAGSFVGDTDGSQVPLVFVDDGYGLYVPTDSSDFDVPRIPITGDLYSTGLIYWPTDTALQAYVVNSLSNNGIGKFTFDHLLSTQAD